MNCPKCDTKTKAVDNRSDRDQFHHINLIGTVRRVRSCLGCQHRFITIEMTENELDVWGRGHE